MKAAIECGVNEHSINGYNGVGVIVALRKQFTNSDRYEILQICNL